jgi:hypothetical protein
MNNKLAVLAVALSFNVHATMPITKPMPIEQIKAYAQENKVESLHLVSVRLMDISIIPSNEGCIIFDLDGNKLSFPNFESERLLLNEKVAFNKKCLAFIVRD